MKKTIVILLVLVLGLTVEVAKADFTFGEPTKVPNVNSSSHEHNPSISADGLSLYFISTRPGGVGGRDIWITTRETTDDDWGEPVNLGPTFNTPVGEYGVSISSDGLSLYFDTRQSGASGAVDDLWVATRATTDDDWSNPISLGPTVNSSADECYPSVSSDGLAVYFCSNRSGGIGTYDLWVTTRATTGDDWAAPANLGPTVNSSGGEADPGISADGLMLFFASATRPGYGDGDIWMTMRTTTNDDWGEPVNLGIPVNSAAWETCPNVSLDGSCLFFVVSQSARHSGGDIWQAPIIPIVDFNSDGFIDIEDLLIMIDNLGTDDSICDIGPMPWGDGIVDEADIDVLMSYWGEDIGLVTHWKLDETEGTTIHDSVNNIKAQLYGDPVWQPANGMVDGALMLDGIDDFVGTWDIPGLSDGDFSVFLWIKGGNPGQVVVSEYQGVNWLMADETQGYLKTDLTCTMGRSAGQSLVSEVTITDGQWHRIGLTWDGTNRVLYVDDVAVASDTQTSLERSTIGLNIGCGPNEESGTFFSGLIDDVRIYDRAITP
jgi:hypothetical protein